MPILNLYIVRHAETFLNYLESNQGWIDSDLTENGIAMLEEKYNNINLPLIDKVYCSDLGRAKNSFNIISPYVEMRNEEDIVYTNLLRERFLGSFEGINKQKVRETIARKEGFNSYEELLAERSLEYFIDCTKKYDPNNLSEDFQQFSGRLNKIISIIKNDAIENNWEHILIMSHANPISFIIDLLLDNEVFNVEKNKVENGQLIHLKSNYDLTDWTLKN